ncbi:MAG: histidine kinase [Candidatus Aminicenantes bacterium]|nr:histidine kinase [Candidatus Aminicenantes bacterium]
MNNTCRLAMLLSVFLLVVSVSGQESELRFHRLTIEDGLSQNTVLSLLHGSRGFMWIGTQDGLSRFDGYEFKPYYYDPDNPESIGYTALSCLYQDNNDILWIGTNGGGLSRLDQAQDIFVTYKNDPEDPQSLNSNVVNDITEMPPNTLWIGTSVGLARFIPATEMFQRFLHKNNDPRSLSHNQIHCLLAAKDGQLWLGTQRGLNVYDPQSQTFRRYFHQPDESNSLSNNQINALYQDKKGRLWIGTESGLNKWDLKTNVITFLCSEEGNPQSLSDNRIRALEYYDEDHLLVGTANGLNLLNTQTYQCQRYFNQSGDEQSLSSNQIMSLHHGRSFDIWIGTQSGGVSRINLQSKQFITHLKPEDFSDRISNTNIRSISDENSDLFWLGTRGGGLLRFDRKKRSVFAFTHDPENKNSLSSNNVYSVLKQDPHGLWIGTYGGGLNKYDPEKMKFTHYRHDPGNPNSLSDDFIHFLYKDTDGSLWIGTFQGGLNRFIPETGEFIHFQHDPNDQNTLRSNNIRTLIRGNEGYYWIGTQGGGLSRYDPKTKQFKHYLPRIHDPNSLSQNFILCLYDDGRGKLWIGTAGGGLNVLDKKTGSFTVFTTEHGLPNNVVYAVLEDAAGNLWLSTNKGISKFNPQTQCFSNYDTSDGLQSNEFNYGAFLNRPDGEMLFGGINGFTSFYPEEIENNSFIPPVAIVKFQLYNQDIRPGMKFNGRVILQKTIEMTEEIHLKHDENLITLEFAALNYQNPDKNQYRYIMKGLDKEWNAIGNRRYATYSHITPGRFTFHVQGSNNDGLWNQEGASVRIVISPPFWKTLWFQGLLIIFILSSIVFVFLVRTRYIRRQARMLQKTVRERTSELEKANTELKQEIQVRQHAEQDLRDREDKLESSLTEKEVLLKEIHHRVKNNMQVISSLLRLQASQIKDQKLLDMFAESQARIQSMSLIHENLYQSKDLNQIDFSKYIKNLTQNLVSSYGVQKEQIQLSIEVKKICLDIQQAIPCGLIINELVSNALKHAFPGQKQGKILIHMHQDNRDNCWLKIQDTGIGFPEKIDFRKTTSLGLQLVNGLISQIKGAIELERDKGTSWIIQFPLGGPTQN